MQDLGERGAAGPVLKVCVCTQSRRDVPPDHATSYSATGSRVVRSISAPSSCLGQSRFDPSCDRGTARNGSGPCPRPPGSGGASESLLQVKIEL
jgi:hypothetical protein